MPHGLMDVLLTGCAVCKRAMPVDEMERHQCTTLKVTAVAEPTKVLAAETPVPTMRCSICRKKIKADGRLKAHSKRHKLVPVYPEQWLTHELSDIDRFFHEDSPVDTDSTSDPGDSSSIRLEDSKTTRRTKELPEMPETEVPLGSDDDDWMRDPIQQITLE